MYWSSIMIRSWKNSITSSLTTLACRIRARRTSTTCSGGRGNSASAYSVLVRPRDCRVDASMAGDGSDMAVRIQMDSGKRDCESSGIEAVTGRRR